MPISKEEKTKFNNILDTLLNDHYAYIFKEPVDYVGLGLTDYLDVVKNPMDLGTVKAKLINENYNSYQDVIDDLNLIWANCKLYNLQGSDIYLTAVHMEKTCKKLLEKNFKEKAKVEVKKKTVEKQQQVKKEEESIKQPAPVASAQKKKNFEDE